MIYHVQLKTMFPKVIWEIRNRARNMAVEYLNNKRYRMNQAIAKPPRATKAEKLTSWGFTCFDMRA